MIHRTEPQSEWDRRYKAHVAKKQPKEPKPPPKKRGPVKGQPLPKHKSLGMTVLKMMENP
jgi:hypothetical protein